MIDEMIGRVGTRITYTCIVSTLLYPVSVIWVLRPKYQCSAETQISIQRLSSWATNKCIVAFLWNKPHAKVVWHGVQNTYGSTLNYVLLWMAGFGIPHRIVCYGVPHKMVGFGEPHRICGVTQVANQIKLWFPANCNYYIATEKSINIPSLLWNCFDIPNDRANNLPSPVRITSPPL